MFKIIKAGIFGAMAILGIGILVNQKRKEKRCTEELVCPLVAVKDETAHVNHRRDSYTVGTIEFNAYGKNVTGKVELPAGAKAGQTVTIRFNPDNPEEFCHEWASFTTATIGWVFAVLGVITMIISLVND